MTHGTVTFGELPALLAPDIARIEGRVEAMESELRRGESTRERLVELAELALADMRWLSEGARALMQGLSLLDNLTRTRIERLDGVIATLQEQTEQQAARLEQLAAAADAPDAHDLH
jgi:hypothetical protein